MQLQIESVICSDFDPFILLRNLTADVQLPGFGVEVGGRDLDEERYVDTCGRCASSVRLGGYSTDGRRAKLVAGLDEVVGMPLFAPGQRNEIFMHTRTRPTISSGSSGKRVMTPEPSFSIFWLMRRIVLVVRVRLCLRVQD